MPFLNHPITIAFAFTLALIIPIAFKKGIRLMLNLRENINQDCEQKNTIEELPNGCELILKASRGELTRDEYAQFCKQREENKLKKTRKHLFKDKRFQSPKGW